MRRGKAKAAASANGSEAAPNGSDTADAEPTMVDAEPTAEPTMVENAPPPPPPPPPAAGAMDPNVASEPQRGTRGGPTRQAGDEFSVNHYLDLGDLFTSPRNASEEERARVAAADFQAAIASSFAGMEGPPPSAATPEDAVRQFVEATGDVIPDPGGNLSDSIYENETSAYYRIRRQFGKGIGRAAGPWTPPPGLGPGSR